MKALELLHRRVSCSRLQAPAPTPEQRDHLYAAASRAADHALLRPWRFLEIEGNGLQALGDLFVAASLADNPDAEESALARVRSKPLRAPLIVVAIARHTEHPKVPQWEQTISAGCAVQNLINAAFAQGVGAYWRTGSMAEHPAVAGGLGLQASEKLIGFIYLGTPAMAPREPDIPDPAEFVSVWPAT